MLVNYIAYRDGKKLGDIPVKDVSNYFAMPETFVWVALKEAGSEELGEMREEFGLHELAVEDARVGHQRPKIEEYGDCFFVVVHLVEEVDKELNVGEVALLVGNNYVLSVLSRSQRSFVGIRDRAEREPHLLKHGPASCSTH